MADNRDVLAQMLAAGQTGGLNQQDFTTFANKLNDPTALQAWSDAGGIFAQNGGQVPDPDEQYFGLKGPISHSGDEMNWMNALQPWQGGASGDLPGTGMNTSGFIGGGSMMRADPAYWGWQGRGQGYAPGSMGDLSGFNNNRGSAAGGTGGLTSQDFATFSRLVSPQALQEWLNAGGVQGQFGGGMGGAVGGGGGGSGGGGGGGYGGGGGGGGSSLGGGGGGGRGGGGIASGYSNAGYNPGDVSRGPDLGNVSGAFEGGVNQAGFNGYGAGIAQGFGPSGFGIGNTSGYSGQVGFSPGLGMSMGSPGQGFGDGWGADASGVNGSGGVW